MSAPPGPGSLVNDAASALQRPGSLKNYAAPAFQGPGSFVNDAASTLPEPPGASLGVRVVQILQNKRFARDILDKFCGTCVSLEASATSEKSQCNYLVLYRADFPKLASRSRHPQNNIRRSTLSSLFIRDKFRRPVPSMAPGTGLPTKREPWARDSIALPRKTGANRGPASTGPGLPMAPATPRAPPGGAPPLSPWPPRRRGPFPRSSAMVVGGVE